MTERRTAEEGNAVGVTLSYARSSGYRGRTDRWFLAVSACLMIAGLFIPTSLLGVVHATGWSIAPRNFVIVSGLGAALVETAAMILAYAYLEGSEARSKWMSAAGALVFVISLLLALVSMVVAVS
jgi:hypothetical protein